jgi:hypothetical protein
MFEPKDFLSKRAAMNEILLQQLFGYILHTATPQMKQHLLGTFEQHAKGQQRLKDVEADRVLGDVKYAPGVLYATHETMLNYLMANVGRTYFGVENHTSAPDGSIGTAGFGTKFKDWLGALPDYDTSIGRSMVSGFYRDNHTKGPSNPVPLLVLRNGNELITIVFNGYVSVMTLNLDHVPADYRWDNHNHQALRGEMFSYRGDLSIPRLEEELRNALVAQGITELQIPVDVGNVIGVSEVAPGPIGWPALEGMNFDERFESAMKLIADPNTAEDDRSGLKLILSDVVDNELANNPNEDIYKKKSRLTEALLGLTEILSFESWMADHYEDFKTEVSQRYSGRDQNEQATADLDGLELEVENDGDIPNTGEEVSVVEEPLVSGRGNIPGIVQTDEFGRPYNQKSEAEITEAVNVVRDMAQNVADFKASLQSDQMDTPASAD